MEKERYHITKNGEVKLCNATVKPCPLSKHSPHFDSKGEAEDYLSKSYGTLPKNAVDYSPNEMQEIAMISTPEQIAQYKEEINSSMDDLKGLRRIQAKTKLAILDNALRGENYLELREKERLEHEEKIKREEEEKAINLEKFSALEQLELPSSIEKYIVTKPFSRHNVKAYRGEMSEEERVDDESNSGLGMFGQGIYTTTSRKYAKKFGNVRTVDPEEMPVRPLRLNTTLSFSELEYKIAEQYNIKRNDLYKNMEVEDLVIKLGYDGLTLGPDDDMIIVMFDTERNKHKFK